MYTLFITTMPGRISRLVWPVLLSLAVAACSGTTTPSGATAAASTSQSHAGTTPRPSLPPANAQFSFTGGAAGAEQIGQIACNNPSLGGSVITIFGQATGKDVFSLVTVEPGKVIVRLDSGSSTSYVERDFSGTGVSAFNAAKGAQIDSQLSEVTSPQKPGTLPSVSSIKGSVDCGNQLPGSSTLVLTGSVPEGVLNGPLGPVRVECLPHAQPPDVRAVGLTMIGSTRVLVIFQASPSGFTAYIPPTTTTKQHFFGPSDPTTAMLTATGAHISGSAAETGVVNTLQVRGDLVCGTIDP